MAVGYPERFRPHPSSREELFNSLIVVNGDGENVANYRKSSLYYTDDTWASEGGGFYGGYIGGLGNVAMGICMDINPYKFKAPWAAFEFAFHVLEVRANVVIVSMAWNTLEDAKTFNSVPEEPDMDTLTYWVRRMEPIIRAEREDEIIVIFANRCGVEGDAVYAGTSAVIGIQNGEVCVYGLLGRGVKELLIVDTDGPSFAKLADRPEGLADSEEEVNLDDPMSESPSTSEKEEDEFESEGAVYLDGRNYTPTQDVSSGQGYPSPRATASYQKKVFTQDSYTTQTQNPPREVPTYRRQASPRDGYSPRFAAARGEHSPRVGSPREGYSYSPTERRSPRVPSPRDWYASNEPSPRTQAPEGAYGWGGEEPDLASPVFPEPTPQSARPKLAISTGPETLPPVSKKAAPRGVQPGNFFTSRDLCTPPETPFDDEPQPYVQQQWPPSSSFMYTPKEPEWPPEPQARRATPAIPHNRLDISRPSSRNVPSRPSSRTQEVKLSDLNDARKDVRSKPSSRSRNASRNRDVDRRPTPGPAERPPKLRSKRSKPSINAPSPIPEDSFDRVQKSGLLAKNPVQNARDSDFPWNSITIAASPSVFQTTFNRAETFPRQQPQSATGWEGSSRPERLMTRRKSISEFAHEPTNNLPLLQPTIFSAVEPKMSTDRMWAVATESLAPKRPKTAFSTKERVARPVAEQLKPDRLSPLSV